MKNSLTFTSLVLPQYLEKKKKKVPAIRLFVSQKHSGLLFQFYPLLPWKMNKNTARADFCVNAMLVGLKSESAVAIASCF